jgi:hypothetical protein
MIADTPIANSTLPIAMAFAGVAFGLVYFLALRRTVALFTAGRGWLLPAALTLGRIGAAVIFLGLAAKLGATALLATFIGFQLARAFALRAARSVG